MLIADLQRILDRLVPFSLAESWDNVGLLVGDGAAPVSKVLATLEMSDAVLEEAIAGGYDTVLTHHPLLFAPIKRVVASDAAGRQIAGLIQAGISVISCHTNLDSAPGGIADAVADVLDLRNVFPLQAAARDWYKFVGFIPREAVTTVTQAVFAAGAGEIGEYSDCAYALEGEGWFRPGPYAQPAIGEAGEAERVSEIRWETVVPRPRLEAVIRAYVAAHPYEEPAFDVYPVEDRAPRAGLGRVGEMEPASTVEDIARRLVDAFGLSGATLGGERGRRVRRVATVPGAGRTLLEAAAAVADVYVTGDLGYHDSDQAKALGLGLVVLGHGELEWAAMRRWVEESLRLELEPSGITLTLTEAWRSPWETLGGSGMPAPGGAALQAGPQEVAEPPVSGRVFTVFIDGGSRGNPGPSAIGVVVRGAEGEVLEEISHTIGITTNNVAEYMALIEGLEVAARRGARRVEVVSDSELLVKQMQGEYRVKSEGLRPLAAAAQVRVEAFEKVTFRHVRRQENARADALVNQALGQAAG